MKRKGSWLLIALMTMSFAIIGMVGCTPTEELTPAELKSGVISTGLFHSLAIDKNGDIWAWGSNDYGQLGDGTTEDSYVPKKISVEGVKFSFVSAGDGHSLALDTEGGLWTWGWNYFGQVGDNTSADQPSPVHIMPETKFISASAGNRHCLAVDTDGGLWAWGYNLSGQIGDGTSYTPPPDDEALLESWVNYNRFEPVHIMPDTRFTFVSAGYGYSTAIDRFGSLWCWGNNVYGQLGTGRSSKTEADANPYPEGPKTAKTFTYVEAGTDTTFAIDTDGRLWGWGNNEHGQLGDGSNNKRTSPVAIKRDHTFSYVTAGSGSTYALDTFGNLWAWGNNYDGQLRNESNEDVNTPVNIMTEKTFSCVSANKQMMALDGDGTLWAWGNNMYGQVGDGTGGKVYFKPQKVNEGKQYQTVVAYENSNMAIDNDGALWAWGRNDKGQLGDGTQVDKFVPVRIMEDKTFVSVSMGSMRSYAVDSEGNIWGWGSNTDGLLGDGTQKDALAPVQVKCDAVIKQISVYEDHCVALDENGNIWAWGYNKNGQVGNKSRKDAYLPVQITTETVYTQVVAGKRICLAIDNDHALWGWGQNLYTSRTESGNLVTHDMTEPTAIYQGLLLSFIDSFFIAESDYDYNYGFDVEGNFYVFLLFVSPDPSENTYIRKMYEGLTLSYCTIKGDHQFMIDKENILWCWGNNENGQLGLGKTSEYEGDLQKVSETLQFSMITVGSTHTVALDTEGNMYVWGNNDYGQYGNGYTMGGIGRDIVQLSIEF